MTISKLALAFAFALGAPQAAFAGDWADHADEKVIRVVTHDEDGSERRTKVWLVVLDGQGYLRTGSTSWGKNVQRSPDLRILTASDAHDLRAELVSDEATRAAVQGAFRAKYGWSDRLVSPFRGGSPAIMRLLPRPDGA